VSIGLGVEVRAYVLEFVDKGLGIFFEIAKAKKTNSNVFLVKNHRYNW
jgi:hypothetical protein